MQLFEVLESVIAFEAWVNTQWYFTCGALATRLLPFSSLAVAAHTTVKLASGWLGEVIATCEA